MLGHLSFGVADLARAIRFYDAVLAPLGYVRVWTIERQAGYGAPGGGDKLALKLQPAPVIPPGPGFHLALVAPSPAAVDRFHAEALRAGGSDEAQRGLCYDQHRVWMVTVVATVPAILLCVLRGGVRPVGQDSASLALWRNIQRYWILRRICRSISCSASIERRSLA